MRNHKLKLIAGILLIVLGTIHQTVHILSALNPDQPSIVEDMAAFKINLMGSHTLMQFHSGFSLMTGFFLIGLGMIVVLLRKRPIDRLVDVVLLTLMLIIAAISVSYFHVLAYGVTGLAVLFYSLSFLKWEKS